MNSEPQSFERENSDETKDSAANIIGNSAEVCCQLSKKTEAKDSDVSGGDEE